MAIMAFPAWEEEAFYLARHWKPQVHLQFHSLHISDFERSFHRREDKDQDLL
jgi:hypothetical protein